jgi:2'-5' RNA ligase
MRRMAFSYGCLMVDLPDYLSKAVRDYSDLIPLSLKQKTEDMPGGVPKKVHITVKYGILTEDVKEVADVVCGTSPIIVKLGRTSVFYNQDSIVLKIDVCSSGIRALNRKICKNLETVNTYGEYKPHVTIAYLVKNDADPYYYTDLLNDNLEGQEFEVGQAEFSSASGRHYKIDFDGHVYVPSGDNLDENETIYSLFSNRVAKIASRIV